MSDYPLWLVAFANESNHIEGMGAATEAEIDALGELVYRASIGVPELEHYVKVVAPGHKLRRKRGLNVRVGDHIAPPGGPDIEAGLQHLLATLDQGTPYSNHVAYELVHPFTDGNGRSGRALWLWEHIQNGTEARPMALGFLHTFYYETLSNARRP